MILENLKTGKQSKCTLLPVRSSNFVIQSWRKFDANVPYRATLEEGTPEAYIVFLKYVGPAYSAYFTERTFQEINNLEVIELLEKNS